MKLDRRKVIKSIFGGSSLAFFSSSTMNIVNAKENKFKVMNKNIKQSVCSWCFPQFSLDELSKIAKEIGLIGIDLVPPSGWKTLKNHGLKATLCTLKNIV